MPQILTYLKASLNLGKESREKVKETFSVATTFRYILKAWKRQKGVLCPEAQHLGSCPCQNM